MTEAARTGVLGGTLDPIHVGHLDAAAAAREALALEQVLVIPALIPPHRGEPSGSPFHRFAMAALAVNGLDGFSVSDMELLSSGPSFTAETLTRLHARGLSASQIFFITGADAFAEIATWHRYPAVLDLAHFAVVSRPGTTLASMRARLPHLKSRMRLARTGSVNEGEGTLIFLVDAPTADVSSTEIRRRVADGCSIAGLVAPAVEHHIRQHGLYSRPSLARTAADGLHGQD
jgi:nicotinate-nucleotide adenylyltransferase